MSQYSLPSEFKEKWIKALRSGQYKQGKLRLYKLVEGESRYCCLGVGCKISGVPDRDLKYSYIPRSSEDKTNNHVFKTIPNVIKGTNGLSEKLSKMNDVFQFTFLEIAHWIEHNVKGV